MNRFIVVFMVVLLGAVSCNRPNADQFFQTTILNTNIINDFASDRFGKQLTYDAIARAKNSSTTPAERTNAQSIVNNKAAYIKQTIEKIEDLTPPDADAEVIKVKALDLYRFVLPVYENEYLEMAKMADSDSLQAVLEEKDLQIQEKYGHTFFERFDEFYALGKSYAEKHKLNVKFDE